MASSSVDMPEISNELLMFKDFVPLLVQKKKYEALEILIDKANLWLSSNDHITIVNCETFNIKCHTKKPTNPELMVYTRFLNNVEADEPIYQIDYLRCLRLWYLPLRNSQPEQIGLRTILPKKGGNKLFQSLDEFIKSINCNLKQLPLQGKIISIEIKPFLYRRSKDNNDPSKSHWSEPSPTSTDIHLMVVCRIFYRFEEPVMETVDIKDFSPNLPANFRGKLTSDVLHSLGTFKDLVNGIPKVYNSMVEGRISNMHTLDVKMKFGRFEVDRQITTYTEHSGAWTKYWRILRLFILRPIIAQGLKPPLNNLSYKSFSPVRLTNDEQFESLTNTFSRIQAWLSATQAQNDISLICIETLPIRLDKGGEKYFGSEATWTINKSNRPETWIYIIRLYFNGVYVEPNPKILPAVPPVLTTNTCTLQ